MPLLLYIKALPGLRGLEVGHLWKLVSTPCLTATPPQTAAQKRKQTHTGSSGSGIQLLENLRLALRQSPGIQYQPGPVRQTLSQCLHVYGMGGRALQSPG